MSARDLQIKEIISECVRSCPMAPEQMVASMQLIGDLGADSLEIVEIAMAIEEQFGIDVDDEAAEKFETVGDVIEHVRQYDAEKA